MLANGMGRRPKRVPVASAGGKGDCADGLARHFDLSPQTQRPQTCDQETHGWILQFVGFGKDWRNWQPGPEMATHHEYPQT